MVQLTLDLQDGGPPRRDLPLDAAVQEELVRLMARAILETCVGLKEESDERELAALEA